MIATSFTGYHWIYWVGPFLGSLVAVTFYKLVKALEYETVNPGQDMNEKEASKFVEDEPTPVPVAALASGDQTAQYSAMPGQGVPVVPMANGAGATPTGAGMRKRGEDSAV